MRSASLIGSTATQGAHLPLAPSVDAGLLAEALVEGRMNVVSWLTGVAVLLRSVRTVLRPNPVTLTFFVDDVDWENGSEIDCAGCCCYDGSCFDVSGCCYF